MSWVYGSFKITLPNGNIRFVNSHKEVVFTLDRTALEIQNDFIAEEKMIIKDIHKCPLDSIIEVGPIGFVENLNDLPKRPWAAR